MFEKIKNDPYIIDCYLKADDPNSEDGFWVYHGLKHINNVVDMVEKILIQFNYDTEYIENAKIAALLHDVGFLGIKEDHEIRSYEMTKKYFEENNIDIKYKDEVLNAIKCHRDGFDSDSFMTLVLILADKIDIKKSRLAPNGYMIDGLNEYKFIDDIKIIKNNDEIVFKFIIGSDCDKKKLEEFYFTAKVLKSIKSFSEHLSLKLKILWNDEEWIINK